MECNPDHFLDCAISLESGSIKTNVYTKNNKVPIFWSSRVPKRYKRNAIKGELHRAHKISSHFNEELTRIRKKFNDVGYPSKFVESLIREFLESIEIINEVIIPPWLFEDRVTKYIRIPFCESNENLGKQFIERLNTFTGNKFKFVIIWETRSIRSLFPLKDKIIHVSCVIYEGTCTCGDKYIGETKRIANIRFDEHNNPEKNSEPSKHLRKNTTHSFIWKVITSAPRFLIKRKILEAFFYCKFKPKLNEQLVSQKLFLFRHGIT